MPTFSDESAMGEQSSKPATLGFAFNIYLTLLITQQLPVTFRFTFYTKRINK